MVNARISRVVNVAIFFVSVIFPRELLADDDLLGFLFVSAPSKATIYYLKLTRDGNSGLTPTALIGPTGLNHPQGIAIDHKRHRLFVADPDAQKIYAYVVETDGDKVTCDGRQTIISSGIESRWVAVDGLGNVFFSDEPNSRVYKITMTKILRGNTEAEIVYDGTSVTQVNRPGGVAVDNFHVYWTNKHFGTQIGTVVKAAEVVEAGVNMSDTVNVLAQNIQKSYGVCLAMNNVFYTDSEQRIYGVKKAGGEVKKISSMLLKPRGCVWDGDGTIYVADRGNNAVYSFAGNMHQLTTANVKKVFELEDAFGVTFLNSATRVWSWFAFVACLSSFVL